MNLAERRVRVVAAALLAATCAPGRPAAEPKTLFAVETPVLPSPPVASASSEVGVAHQRHLDTYLVPDAAERFKRRAWVANLGELRLLHDGPVVAHGPGAARYDVELVVVDDGSRVGAVIEQGGFQLLIYVDPADLAEVVIRDVKLAAGPDQTPDPDDVGIFLHVGARPEVAERRGALARVSGGCDEFDYDGWMSGDALGRVFDGQEERAAQVDAFLASDSELFASPGGARLARFHTKFYETREFEHDVQRIGRPRRGFQKVEHQSWFCTVQAWAKLADVASDGPGNDLWGGEGLDVNMCDRSAGTEMLPAGVWLQHASSQVTFATSEHPARLARVSDATDNRLCLPTSWGPLEVRALPTL